MALIKYLKWPVLGALFLGVILGLVLMDPGYFALLLGKMTGNALYGLGEGFLSPLVGSIKPEAKLTREITIDVLNSHETVKLITREVQSRLTFEETEKYGWLSNIVGERRGTLEANITFVYGVNIESVEPKHITVTDTAVVVDLPPLTALYVIPDLDSIEYHSESSFINRLIDRVHNLSLKQEIFETLRDDARTLSHQRGIKPSEEEIFTDLESTLGPLIREKTERRLVFR